MNVENMQRTIERAGGFEQTMGMELISTPEADTCVARMAVTHRHTQPFGLLSGGMTLALAETVAGVGSSSLCPGAAVMGMTVSGSHVRAAREGETVTATARLIHQGRTTHVWQVSVTNEAGRLVSQVQVTNYVKLRINN